ncbi:translation initiation factor IF-3 [Candidatus Zinderia endosymbiont of Aphrophora alni]|uniref:translation initiation factor IF-3 n=1 Tax=Candidatus Zinderia endosymbiont of Aphrophora alni TaxID=3077951 RepID=UPI0030D291CB
MKKKKIFKKKKTKNRIIATKIRLVGINNEQLGIMNLKIAILIAKKKNTDLVEINSNAKPPIVKLINYGKFQYIKEKKEQKIKFKKKIIQTKEIKFKPNINFNDINIKIKKIKKILINKNKIKISIYFIGREISFEKKSTKIIEKIKKNIKFIGQIEKLTKIDKKQINLLISPKI